MRIPSIRFIRFLRIRRRGQTPRRLAAAKRNVAAQIADAKSMLPIFRDEVLAEIETPESRIERFDDQAEQFWKNMRRLQAMHWIEARRLLRLLQPDDATRCVIAWNSSGIPKSASFLVGFVKSWPDRRKELDASLSEEQRRISDRIPDWTPAVNLSPRERLDVHELVRRGMALQRYSGNSIEWKRAS